MQFRRTKSILIDHISYILSILLYIVNYLVRESNDICIGITHLHGLQLFEGLEEFDILFSI